MLQKKHRDELFVPHVLQNSSIVVFWYWHKFVNLTYCKSRGIISSSIFNVDISYRGQFVIKIRRC